MTPKSSIDQELFAMIGFGELEKEDTRGEIIDVAQPKSDKAIGELVCYHLPMLSNVDMLYQVIADLDIEG